MRRSWYLSVPCAVLLLLVVGLLAQTRDDREPSHKPRPWLPPLWDKLDLSEEQKQHIEIIHQTHQRKIRDLRKQMEQLERQEADAEKHLLTDGQRDRLKELLRQQPAPETTGKQP